jgi:hypothetical protein
LPTKNGANRGSAQRLIESEPRIPAGSGPHHDQLVEIDAAVCRAGWIETTLVIDDNKNLLLAASTPGHEKRCRLRFSGTQYMAAIIAWLADVHPANCHCASF